MLKSDESCTSNPKLDNRRLDCPRVRAFDLRFRISGFEMQDSCDFKFAVWVLCLVFLFPTLASAETRGQVVFGGVPVPGATVTATHGEKEFVTITDPMGMYVLPDLPEGTWSIEIEMLGFAKLQ